MSFFGKNLRKDISSDEKDVEMLIKLIFQIILLQLIIHSGRHGSSRPLIKLEHGRE